MSRRCEGYCLIFIVSTENEWVCLLDILRDLSNLGHYSKEGQACYVAIVGPYEKVLFNQWLCCKDQDMYTHSPVTSKNSKRNSFSLTWKTLITNFQLQDCPPSQGNISVADQIHTLLDHIPWDIEDYVTVDVILIVPEFSNPPVDLYGALWRISTWLHGSIHFVIEKTLNSVWLEWSKHLLAYVGNYESITKSLSEQTIWKGPLHIQECGKTTSHNQSSTIFNGFKLTLQRNVSIEDLGMSSSYYPSYLEVVGSTDVSDIPLLHISSVQLNLSVNGNNVPSLEAYKRLFQQSPYSGVLLRFCGNKRHRPSHRSTQEWKMYVLEQEAITNECLPVTSPVFSFGPLFLVSPLDISNTYKSPVWVLHKPQSLSILGDFLQKIQTLSISQGMTFLYLLDVLKHLNMADRFDVSPFVCLNESLLFHERNVLNCSEFIALENLQDIFKEKMKNPNDTSELTLGGILAPPTTIRSIPATEDILRCFTDSGEPVLCSELIPIAMGNALIHMTEPDHSSSISYRSLIGSTPTRAGKYHGINYCFTDKDKARDCKLMKIQQRYISRERSCNCSNYQTPCKRFPLKKHRLNLLSGINDGETSLTPQDCDKVVDTVASNEVKLSEMPQIPTIQPNKDCDSDDKTVPTTFTEMSNSGTCSSSKSEEVKWTTKSLKKYLQECIVSSLKGHGFKRSHTSFRKSYGKVFKISKMFIKELNTTKDMKRQISKIVDKIVRQVAEFELDQAQVTHK